MTLTLVVFVDRSESDTEIIHLVSARKAVDYEKASTTTSSAKKLTVSEATKLAYRKRNRALDRDADAPQLPPEYWANASIGKYYRPLETQISFRVDNEVLDWLESKGPGHLSRINEILRDQMTRERG